MPASQPELQAFPRESLCKASDPQTGRGRCKVSLKGMKSRLAIIMIVPLRGSSGTDVGLHYCSGVSTKPYLFIFSYHGFKNGSSQILGHFSKSPFRTFLRSDSFSVPLSRFVVLCAFCVRLGQRIVTTETYFSYETVCFQIGK